MKMKKAVAAGLAIALAAGLAGCHMKKYERVALETREASPVGLSGSAQQESKDEGERLPVSTEPPGGGAEAAVSGSSADDSASAAASRAQEIAGSGQSAAQAVEGSQAETAAGDSSVWEERDETVYITADRLNIRKEPDAGGELAAVLNYGEELKRTGIQSGSGWSRVEYQGAVCYASSQYLTAQKPEMPKEEAGSAVSSDAAEVGLDPGWKYAENSKINSGKAVFSRSTAADRKGRVVCVNAGHGTSGGESVKTLCHPDGTPKVTGGTTGAGATSAVAVSSGMTFSDGTPERKVTLAMALALREKLLARGYDVLMIRETDDVQLDNVARTVIANNSADCHLALHWDSTASDKGAFYMSVPGIASYRAMEPVASHWQEHHALGDSLIAGLKGVGAKIFSSGSMEMDLTQTSYSTVPSVDIELGDKASDHSAAALENLAEGLADGIDIFFGN